MSSHTPEAAPSPEQDRNVRDLLEARWAEGKFLCVGLDVSGIDASDNLYTLMVHAKQVVEATKHVAAAYKPNSAFYEARGSHGLSQLEVLVRNINKIAPDVPVIWDAKRADIANTNNGYRDAREALGADGMTVHPYLGGTAVVPLLDNPNRLSFVLGHTSNPGADEFQHLELRSGEQMWERVVHNVAHSSDWDHGGVKGIVMGATYPEWIGKARHIAGDDVVILVPGIGKQGGDLDASVRGAMNSRGNGFLINVSSGISGSERPGWEDFEYMDSVRERAENYHNEIKSIWEAELANPSESYEVCKAREDLAAMAVGLHAVGAVKFDEKGQFKLKSGGLSPVYFDLAASLDDPKLRSMIANTYIGQVNQLEELNGRKFDLIGSIPQRATSYGAIVADRMGRRLAQPRAGVKEHGTRKGVEGRFEAGESIVLLDDLITKGDSKIEAIAQVEEAGLVVDGLAVFLDREQGGAVEMARQNRTMVSHTTLIELLNILHAENKVSDNEFEVASAYLEANRVV